MVWGWGVVVAVNRVTSGKRRPKGTADAPGGAAGAYTIDTLLKCSKQHAGSIGTTCLCAMRAATRPVLVVSCTPGTRPQPAQSPEDAELQVVPVPLPLLSEISLLRITIPSDLRPADHRNAVLLSLQVLRSTLPLLTDVHCD